MKPLFTFFGLAYLISWLIWLPLYGHVFGLGRLPTLPFQHGLGGLGPMVAAFITSWFYYRKKGIGTLLKRCVQFRPLIYFGIALFASFLLLLIAISISVLSGQGSFPMPGDINTGGVMGMNWFTFFVYNLVFFGFGEEIGWRGYALPRLQQHKSALVSSVVLTGFWAVWHWPLFLYRSGFDTMGLPEVLGWLISLLTGSVLLTWLFNSSRGSILVCAIFHTTIDMAFTANLGNGDVSNYLGFLVTLWGVLVVILWKPRNLSPRESVKEAI